MAAPVCASPVELCAVRITRLNSDGTAADGPDNSYVVTDPIQLQYTPNVREGDEHELLGGCDGCVIATKTDRDTIRRYDLELQSGRFEPGLLEMMLGATLIDTTDGPLGIMYGEKEECGTASTRVAIETWSKRWTVDDEWDPDWPWQRFIWPSVAWVPAQATQQADFTPETLTGKTRRNSAWGFGPYFDQPFNLGANLIGVFADDAALPTATCDYSTIAT